MQQLAVVWEVISCPSGTSQLSLLLPHLCASEEKSWMSWDRGLWSVRTWSSVGHSCPIHPLPAIRTVRLGAVEGFPQVGPLLGASTLHPTGPQMWSPQPKCPGALVNTGFWAPPESFPFEGLGCAQVPRDADSAGDLLVLGTTGPGYVVTCLTSMGLSIPIWDTRGPILNSWGRKQQEREEIQYVEIENRKMMGEKMGPLGNVIKKKACCLRQRTENLETWVLGGLWLCQLPPGPAVTAALPWK